MIPHDDGYLPVFLEGEEPYIDWFRGGACGLLVSAELWYNHLVWKEWQPKHLGIVEKVLDRNAYIVAPKPFHLLLRWLPWWKTWEGKRYPYFSWSLRAPKWDIWYAKPGCFGMRLDGRSVTRYSREMWDERAPKFPFIAPYPRFGLAWGRW